MKDKIKKEKIDLIDMFKAKPGRIFFIILFTIIIQRIVLMFRGFFGNSFLNIYLLIIGALSVELIIFLVELTIYFNQKGTINVKKIFNRLNIKGKPRLFEYLFFLSLFLAAIYSSFVASAFYIENMSVEVIKNSWSFVVYYGFAIAFGWYHYIEKLDE
jgi:hypothetical protein